MLATRAADASCASAYVNQVCGQDELVFDGGSMVFDAEGDLVARAALFREELLIADVDHRAGVPQAVARSAWPRVTEPAAARRRWSASTPVAHAEPAARAPRAPSRTPTPSCTTRWCSGTGDYVRKNGFTDVVIGLSGGIDSTSSPASRSMRSAPITCTASSMPSRYSSDDSRTDAAGPRRATSGIDFRTDPHRAGFAAYLDMLAPSFEGRPADLTEENLQSRIRGITLMALSNKFGWMVLTTGNKSEMAVGYFTIYGDTRGWLRASSRTCSRHGSTTCAATSTIAPAG